MFPWSETCDKRTAEDLNCQTLIHEAGNERRTDSQATLKCYLDLILDDSSREYSDRGESVFKRGLAAAACIKLDGKTLRPNERFANEAMISEKTEKHDLLMDVGM